MAFGSGDPDADAGMGIGVGAGGFGGDGTGNSGFGGGEGMGGYGGLGAADTMSSLMSKYAPSFGSVLGKTLLGTVTASPLGVVGTMAKTASDYNTAMEKAKAQMKASGMFSDAAIEAAAKSYTGGLGLGGATSGGGKNGGEFGIQSTEVTGGGGKPNMENSSNVEGQLAGMFSGPTAPYDMTRLMQDFTMKSALAGRNYQRDNSNLRSRWNDFVSDFDSRYANLEHMYNANRQGQNENYADYRAKIAAIPQLSMKLPDSMGGDSFAMAPKNWTNTLSQQAATTSDILGKALNSINSQAESLNPWAQTVSTGLSNVGVADQNAYTNAMSNLQNQFRPFETGYDMSMIDKQLANKMSLAKLDQPNSFDRWAPVAAAALPKAIEYLPSAISALGNLF